MEATTAIKWLTKERLSLIREFFAYILLFYFIYQYKLSEAEKIKILQNQIEQMSKNKDGEKQQLDIINKLINNEKYNSHSTTKSFPNDIRE